MTAPQLYPKHGEPVVVDHVKYRIRGRILAMRAPELYELELAKPMSRKPGYRFSGRLGWDKEVGLWRAVQPYELERMKELA